MPGAIALFPGWPGLVTQLIALGILLHAARRIAWLQQSQAMLTRWFAATTLIALLWQLRAGIDPGQVFHLGGGCALTLIAGPYQALIGMAVVILVDTLQGHTHINDTGLTWLIWGLLPVLLTQQWLRYCQRKLPTHFFVYLFCNGFAAAAASMALIGLSLYASLPLTASTAHTDLLSESLPFFLLLTFPEAFMTGLVITLLAVWHPQWLGSFDDRLYLSRNSRP